MTLEQMVSTLSGEMPDCPLATLREQLRWAQRELCAQGNAWIVDDGPVVVGANTLYAEIDVPAGAEAVRIISLRNEQGQELKPGFDYIQTAENAVQFRLQPTASTMLGKLACKPAFGRDMPAVLLARWCEALMNGARHKLYLLPQPWRDPAYAQGCGEAFLTAQAESRQLASVGFQAGSVSMRVPRFV